MPPRAYWDAFGCSNDDLDRFGDFHHFRRSATARAISEVRTLRMARAGVPRPRLWFYMCDAAPKTRQNKPHLKRSPDEEMVNV